MNPLQPRVADGSASRATLAVIAKLIAVIVACFVFAAFSSAPAHSQTLQSKIAGDLRAVIDAPTTPKTSWAKDVNGVRYAKVLVCGP